MDNFNNEVLRFIEAANKYHLKMLLVGGSAVNYYGYKRHSADVDFWIKISDDNLGSLKRVLNDIGYKVEELPATIKNKQQNISLKISPELEIELLTSFDPGKSFDEAFRESELYQIEGNDLLKWNIISLEDLISSKISTNRTKDRNDIEVLQEILRLKKGN